MTTAYRAPKEPGYLGSYNWTSTVIGILLLLVSNVVATQYIAAAFAYQPALGDPLYIVGHLAIYQPFKWGMWLVRFGGGADYAVRQPMLNSALIFSVGALVSLITVALLNTFHNKKLTTNTEDLHGSARWATEKELRETGLLSNRKGVYVGGWTNPKTGKLHYLKDDSTEHVLLYAPTGSGKGVSICIPTLLAWEESVVVYDIKGENWAKTAGFRQAAGQVCLKFAPVESDGVRFNPLAEIRIGTDREVSDAQNLAEMLCRTGKESPADEHWTTTAVSLITGLILHICYVARWQRRFATLSDLSAALTPVENEAPTPTRPMTPRRVIPFANTSSTSRRQRTIRVRSAGKTSQADRLQHTQSLPRSCRRCSIESIGSSPVSSRRPKGRSRSIAILWLQGT